jgi:hypothetical protein
MSPGERNRNVPLSWRSLLVKDEFTSFLYIENNCHWSGLYRKGLGAAGDMEKLRIDNASTKVELHRFVVSKIPALVETIAG